MEPKKHLLPDPNVQSRLQTQRASSFLQFKYILGRSYKEKLRDWAPLNFRLL